MERQGEEIDEIISGNVDLRANQVVWKEGLTTGG